MNRFGTREAKLEGKGVDVQSPVHAGQKRIGLRRRHLSGQRNPGGLQNRPVGPLLDAQRCPRTALSLTAEIDGVQEVLDLGIDETIDDRVTLVEWGDVALDALPEVFRDAVWLRDVEEFSYAEIAQMLDVAPGTVMSRISRGRRLLLQHITSGAPAASAAAGGGR